MGREGVDRLYARAKRTFLAEDLHRLVLVLHQPPPERAFRLEADDEDYVARVAHRRLQVVHHAPAFAHPARRDDDHRPAQLVE